MRTLLFLLVLVGAAAAELDSVSGHDLTQYKEGINLREDLRLGWVPLDSEVVMVPIEYARKMADQDVEPDWGGFWYWKGYSAAKALKRHAFLRAQCGHGYEGLKSVGIVDTIPEGECRTLQSGILQWLSNTQVIVEGHWYTDMGGWQKTYLVDFPEKNAPENRFYGIVKRNGTVTYRNMLGKTQKAQHLIVVETLEAF